MPRKTISECKSARRLSMDEAVSLFTGRREKMASSGLMPPSLLGHTTVELSDDGRLQVRKNTGLKISAQAASKVMTDMNIPTLAQSRGIKWRDSMAGRVVPYYASDERVDRHGDIVRQHWDLANFAKNSLVLYAHDWNVPPLGASIFEQVVERSDPDYAGPALWLLALLSDSWEWGVQISNLVLDGFLKSGSVGFFPRVIINIEDKDERMGLGLGPWGAVIGDEDHPSELVEWTIATVPANPGAHIATLAGMKSAGRLAPESINLVRDLARRQITRGRGDSAAWSKIDSEIVEAFRAVMPEVRVPTHSELDAPVLLRELVIQSSAFAAMRAAADSASSDTATDPASQPDQSAAPLAVGDKCSWVGNGATHYGQVVSVHTDGEVPDAFPSGVVGTAEAPAYRIQVHVQDGGEWKPTEYYVAAVASQVEKVPDFPAAAPSSDAPEAVSDAPDSSAAGEPGAEGGADPAASQTPGAAPDSGSQGGDVGEQIAQLRSELNSKLDTVLSTLQDVRAIVEGKSSGTPPPGDDQAKAIIARIEGLKAVLDASNQLVERHAQASA